MLNSCSTLKLISNKSWLSDIHKVVTAMHIHSSGGVLGTRKMGYLGNYPTPVWYLANGYANILSLHDITQHYWVTMDTTVENAIILHGANGQQHRFSPLGKGLYKWEHMMDPTTDNPCWLFVTTVCGQETVTLGVHTNMLKQHNTSSLCNCPITKEDIRAADDIFGPNFASLKRKTVWHPNKHVQAGTSAVP